MIEYDIVKFNKQIPFISIDNEIEVWELIQNEVKWYLNGFKTTLDEDYELINSNKTLTANQ